MTQGTVDMPDAMLVAAIRVGDIDAFETLYRRHRPTVRETVAPLLSDPDRVDDAVQETFVRVLQRLDELREPASLTTWLTAIARDVAADIAQEPSPAEPSDTSGPGAAELAEIRALVPNVSGTLAELDPRDAKALAMAGPLDSSLDEIGRELGVAPAAAKAVLRRALRRLRTAQRLQALVHDNTATGPSVAAPVAVLEVDGPISHRTIPLAADLFIGRECAGVDPAQRLIVDDPSVSRLHIELRVDSGTARISAIDRSRNGSLLNGAEMQNGAPIYLLDGDALRIGDTHLVVRFNPIEPAGPDTPAATPAPQSAADVTMIRSRLAVTAIARSSAPIPDELTARLATAAGLFGGIADSVPEVGLMIRWPVTDPPDEADHQCEHFREFAKMLADKAGVPIDWMLTHT